MKMINPEKVLNHVSIIDEPDDNDNTKFNVYAFKKSSIPITFEYNNNQVTIPSTNIFKSIVKSKIKYVESAEEKPKINIERNFFQSVKDKNNADSYTMSIIDYNRKMQKNFNFYLYDDEDIKKIYNEDNTELSLRTLKCMNALASGSFKADIFRFYILYTRGGVWMDDKSILRYPIDHPIFSLDKHDGFMVYGRFVKGIEIALIASKKESPLILKFLNRALKNIEERIYGYCSLAITGPVMCFQVIQEEIKKSLLYFPEDREVLVYEDYSYIIFSVFMPELIINSKVVWMQNNYAVSLLYKVMDVKYYNNLWSRGGIYTDGNNNRPGITGRLMMDAHVIVFYCLIISLGLIFLVLLKGYSAALW